MSDDAIAIICITVFGCVSAIVYAIIDRRS